MGLSPCRRRHRYEHGGMEMDPMPWAVDHALIVFIMWWVMMIAMMVPSAAPTILLFSTIKRKQEPSGRTSMDAYIFLLGYLLMWAAFSIAAVFVQWVLESLGWMSMEMTSSNAILGGIILLAAGLNQFTPPKAACLRHCQSPVIFFSQDWRPGNLGVQSRHLMEWVECESVWF